MSSIAALMSIFPTTNGSCIAGGLSSRGQIGSSRIHVSGNGTLCACPAPGSAALCCSAPYAPAIPKFKWPKVFVSTQTNYTVLKIKIKLKIKTVSLSFPLFYICLQVCSPFFILFILIKPLKNPYSLFACGIIVMSLIPDPDPNSPSHWSWYPAPACFQCCWN